MINALAEGDQRAVIRVANRHRNGTERQIDTMLVRSTPAARISAASS
jgi:hypothetical protein